MRGSRSTDRTRTARRAKAPPKKAAGSGAGRPGFPTATAPAGQGREVEPQGTPSTIDGRISEELYALTIIARHALRSDAFGLTADCAGQGIISSSGLAPQAEVFIREILTGDGAPPAPRPPGWHVLEVEVRRGGARVGRLAAARASGQPYGPEESLVGDALATQAVRILDRGEDLARNRRLTRALTRLEGRLASTSTEQPTKTELEVVHAARLALGFDGAALYLRQAPDQPHKLVCMDGRVPTAVSPGHETERGNATHDGLVSRSIPLKWGDHLAGDLVLFARSDRPAATLTPESVEFLSGRIGVSLGTSGLIESERHQRRLTEALQEASQAIDRALELEEVLDLILGQVMRAFGCDAANFSSYEGEVSRIIRAHGYERFGLSEAEMLNVTFRADEFVNLRRMAMGEAVAVPDTAADEAWVYAPRFEWLRSWAGVPVRYGDTIFGFVMLDSSVPGTFDERATHRLQAFAAHAGAAMHNARLYNRLMREHTRLQLVHTIGRRFSGSLHRDEILDKLAIATTEALGGEGWAVFVPSQAGPGTYELVPTVGAGRSPTTGPDLDEAWVRSVAESFAPDIRSVDGPVGRRTQLAFPLTAGDRTYAVAVVSVVGDLAEPESWLDVLRPVGQQAGLALAKAEEHAAVQRRLAELTALQSIVRHVAGRLEVEAVLREVTRQLNKNLGFPAVQVFMREGEELILRQHSGPSIMVTRLSLGQGIVGRAARLARPEFIPDVRRDPDYIAGLIGTRAEAAVPILAEGSVIGVLNVEASEAEQLDRGALELLTLVADQLSIALQNASLYEAAQTNVEELEARVRERTSQLEQVLEQAVAAERVKAQFVADVSHELRTPLTNIGLYLDLLELSHDDRRGEYMSTLRRETDRLGRLIEQLLAMSHLDTGQAEFHLVPIDLNALLKVLIGDRARLIGRKGLKLELLPEPGLPLVQADPQYLMQVMTNLLSNAVNYTPSGGRISLMTGRSEWQDVAYATLTVRDTGPGIPDEEQGHIFDRFYRGVAARASGVAGTGLGLAISRDIMARHGGRLTVHSVRGSGSSFTLWIPLALASAA